MQENNENEGQVAPVDTAGEGDKRSENRYKDLADKLAQAHREKGELEARAAKEKAELETKAKDAEFRASFAENLTKYPQAKEFEADIRDKHSKGYALEDAIVSSLASKGKFQTPEMQAQAQRQETISQATGGSANTNVNVSGGEDPTFGGDRQKMREELVRLEQKGDISLRL